MKILKIMTGWSTSSFIYVGRLFEEGDAFGERNEVDLWENGLLCIVT